MAEANFKEKRSENVFSGPLDAENLSQSERRGFEHGGSGRIRTCETLASLHAFQACSLNHSDTLPSPPIISNLDFTCKLLYIYIYA